MVVHDLRATAARYGDELGIHDWYIFDKTFDAKIRGEDSAGFSLRVGFGSLGSTLLELLEPLDENSPHVAGYLAEHGEGINHLAYFVTSIGDYRDAISAAGLEWYIDATAPTNEVPWAYLEGGAGSMLLELMERNPVSEGFLGEMAQEIGGPPVTPGSST
jgi:catechol 2,3-dioxygenase-like lactoylglutathione lyase family enzyme